MQILHRSWGWGYVYYIHSRVSCLHKRGLGCCLQVKKMKTWRVAYPFFRNHNLMRGTQLYFCRSLWFEKCYDPTIEKVHTLLQFWQRLRTHMTRISCQNLHSTAAGLSVYIFIFHLQTRVHTLSVRQPFEGVCKSSCIYIFFHLQTAPKTHFKMALSCPNGLILSFSVELLLIPTWGSLFFKKGSILDRSFLKIRPFWIEMAFSLKMDLS